MRFLDASGKDVLPRRDRVWSTAALTGRMMDALAKADEDVPLWLTIPAVESAKTLEKATYSMACFWQGEVRLGSIDGVISTNAGWRGGFEVVDVVFDPQRISRDRLDHAAKGAHCSKADASAEGSRKAKDSDRHYHLRRSALQYLALTPMQRTKVNAALGRGKEVSEWLSPRQREQAKVLKKLWREDRGKLEGLEPPESFEGLADYSFVLERTL